MNVCMNYKDDYDYDYYDYERSVLKDKGGL